MDAPHPVMKWARAYYFPADGSNFLMQIVKHPPPYGVQVESKAEEVTADEVLEWGRSFNLPFITEDAVEIADILNAIRTTVYADEAMSFDPTPGIAEAIATLKRELPVFLNFYKTPFGPQSASAYNSANLLLRSVQNCEQFFTPVAGRRGAKKWHDDVVYLSQVLRRIAAREQLEATLGSPSSEGVGFITQALRRVRLIGPAQSTDTVYKAILRFDDRGKVVSFLPPVS